MKPTLTDEEWRHLDYIDELAKEWETTNVKLSNKEWVEIFPECKSLAIKTLKHDIRWHEAEASNLRARIRANKNDYASKPATEHANIDWIIGLLTKKHDEVEQRIRKLKWELASIEGREKKGEINQDDIMEAKSVPIQDLLGGVTKRSAGRLVALCPLRSEKTASFTIYSNNTYYCFGCSAGGDVINFVMRRDNVPFLEAVKLLINK